MNRHALKLNGFITHPSSLHRNNPIDDPCSVGVRGQFSFPYLSGITRGPEAETLSRSCIYNHLRLVNFPSVAEYPASYPRVIPELSRVIPSPSYPQIGSHHPD